MSEYPEHDKLREVADQTQAAGDFVAWLQDEKDIHLAVIYDNGPWMVAHTPDLHNLLAEWQDIDRGRLEKEKRAMLAAIRTKG